MLDARAASRSSKHLHLVRASVMSPASSCIVNKLFILSFVVYVQCLDLSLCFTGMLRLVSLFICSALFYPFLPEGLSNLCYLLRFYSGLHLY